MTRWPMFSMATKQSEDEEEVEEVEVEAASLLRIRSSRYWREYLASRGSLCLTRFFQLLTQLWHRDSRRTRSRAAVSSTSPGSRSRAT